MSTTAKQESQLDIIPKPGSLLQLLEENYNDDYLIETKTREIYDIQKNNIILFLSLNRIDDATAKATFLIGKKIYYKFLVYPNEPQLGKKYLEFFFKKFKVL